MQVPTSSCGLYREIRLSDQFPKCRSLAPFEIPLCHLPGLQLLQQKGTAVLWCLCYTCQPAADILATLNYSKHLRLNSEQNNWILGSYLQLTWIATGLDACSKACLYRWCDYLLFPWCPSRSARSPNLAVLAPCGRAQTCFGKLTQELPSTLGSAGGGQMAGLIPYFHPISSHSPVLFSHLSLVIDD